MPLKKRVKRRRIELQRSAARFFGGVEGKVGLLQKVRDVARIGRKPGSAERASDVDVRRPDMDGGLKTGDDLVAYGDDVPVGKIA